MFHDAFSSLADYKKCFVYNPFEDEGANSARKAAQQAEEGAEEKILNGKLTMCSYYGGNVLIENRKRKVDFLEFKDIIGD